MPACPTRCSGTAATGTSRWVCGALWPLFLGGGQLLLGAMLGRSGLPEVEEPRLTGAQGRVGQGPLGRQPLLGHSWDCLLAASARVCSPGAGWSGGGAELWSLDGLLGHFLAVPPWLGWHLLTAEPQLPGVRGSHAPTPGAVRAEGLCLAGGRATSCMGWSPGPEAGGSHRCS